jgi:hypothetical protein
MRDMRAASIAGKARNPLASPFAGFAIASEVLSIANGPNTGSNVSRQAASDIGAPLSITAPRSTAVHVSPAQRTANACVPITTAGRRRQLKNVTPPSFAVWLAPIVDPHRELTPARAYKVIAAWRYFGDRESDVWSGAAPCPRNWVRLVV